MYVNLEVLITIKLISRNEGCLSFIFEYHKGDKKEKEAEMRRPTPSMKLCVFFRNIPLFSPCSDYNLHFFSSPCTRWYFPTNYFHKYSSNWWFSLIVDQTDSSSHKSCLPSVLSEIINSQNWAWSTLLASRCHMASISWIIHLWGIYTQSCDGTWKNVTKCFFHCMFKLVFTMLSLCFDTFCKKNIYTPVIIYTPQLFQFTY